MGILKRIKGRVVAGLDTLRDEGRHPGAPIDRGTFRDETIKRDTDESPESPALSDVSGAKTKPSPGGQEYWFLDGDAEGWDETNPVPDAEED